MLVLALVLAPYLIVVAAAVALVVSVVLNGLPATIRAIFPRLN